MQEQQPETQSRGVSRRGFLTGIGAGAAGAAGAAVLPTDALAQQEREPASTRTDRFTRMFELRPFAEPTPQVQQALRDIGAAGGLMDAKDNLAAGPVNLILDPALSANNPDNSGLTAGVTFFGQFLDHDMTFDTTSRLAVPARPERSPNARTPTLDLDSVYGGGPTVSPQLYDPSDRAKFRVESGGQFEDLPRESNGRAIIADPRNDENMMIAGLQVAFLQFHNRVVDMLRGEGEDHRLAAAEAETEAQASGGAVAEVGDSDRTRNVFEEARRLVTWHYQWIIVHEFLPLIVGSSLVNDVLSRGRRFYTPRAGEQSMPVEFQGAAYRFGHTLVRPSYRANLAGDNGNAFFGFIFDPAGEGSPDPIDLRGGARAARRFIGWQTFFNFGGDQAADVRTTKQVDTRISTPLFNLPLGAIASGDQPTALPQRNLLRHLTWSLPSGQAIAARMGIRPLTQSQLRELTPFGSNLDRSTPLWYYILKEAEVAGGARLAGVGARIVAEVFLGLLSLDSSSYLGHSRWQPTLPSRRRGTFGVVDFLTLAGVDPASRGQ
jgi:hypothetical protein